MTVPDSSSPPDSIQSRDDFVRQLRAKAESAAAASVHHASLSQQYMELSQKLAQLAEQAGSTRLADLQHSLQQLEGHIPAPTAGQPLTVSPPNGKTVGSTFSAPAAADTANPTSEDTSSGDTSVAPFASVPVTSKTFDDSPTDKSAAEVVATTSRSRRQRILNVRKIVERTRTAKLAASKRVRVKAKKADLQPRLRTATEELRKGRRSIATSLVIFTLAVVVMSFMTWQLEIETPLPPMLAAFANEIEQVEEPQPVEPPAEDLGEQTEQETEEPVEEVEPEPEPEMPEESAENEIAEAQESAEPEVVEGTEPAATNAGDADMATIDNHSQAGRNALLEKFGGSQASESAVQYGLEWLVSVQHPQGYWDFINVGTCRNAGTVNNPIGGTAYALLPFLAAGQTHKQGAYRKEVGAGLRYLTTIGINTPAGYDLRGMINKRSDDEAPNEAYYVHGAATLALCEAYGITKDRQLKQKAEAAIRFIVMSQDPRGGGWRYNPQEPGSTSVTAIQVMALMAGKKAGIVVPNSVFEGVMHYLDSVQVDGEGRYGYEVQKKTYKSSVTAMALLCRMYLGWGRDDGDLRAGVALLNRTWPQDNLYTMYFATQVMKNWGGEEWERWNALLRDDLVAGQETEGPAKGSWTPRSGAIHARQGGRLLTTTLATLTLEVYYRDKPLLPEEQTATRSEPDPELAEGK